jgi:secreted trypsin-like serine protease
MTLRARWTVGATMMLLVSCASERVTSVEQGLVGGEPLTPIGRATGVLSAGSERCTATLLAPDWVITAAHCLNTAGTVGFRHTPATGAPSSPRAWV